MSDFRPWRGYVNQILYGTPLNTSLSEAMIDRLADEMISQRYFAHPVAAYYDACVAAIASGEALAFDEHQDEHAARDLISRLVQTLDRRRPWPEHWFQEQDIQEWEELRHAPVVADIHLTYLDISRRLHRTFDTVPGEPDGLVLVMRLRTGQLIALKADPPLSESNVQVMTFSDPAQLASDLRSLGGIDAVRRFSI